MIARRGFLPLAAGLAAGRGLGQTPPGEKVRTATISAGDLTVRFRDNSESPRILSGIESLIHRRHAPDFNAFDAEDLGAAAGLNFEHIVCGHRDPANSFTPRYGRQPLYRRPDGRSVVLVREPEDSAWALASTLQYTVQAPHYLDVTFRCRAHDARLFGARRYAILFFASYMNDVADPALHLRGVEKPGADESWISAGAPEGHRDWNRGGTYRHADAADLGYDANHNFRLNSWSYDYPRFTQPFYYGRAAREMVYQVMFDRGYTPRDQVRFSLFKFKLPNRPRPAWDFQYVIHEVEQDREYGFRARVVWKRFVSPEDCHEEYRRWAAAPL